MPKKKKISATEKKLRGKLKYQKTKARKANKALNEAFEKFPKNKRSMFEGKKSSFKTIINSYLNKVYKINNEVSKLNLKLERFNYAPAFKKFTPKAKKNEVQIAIGLVWQVAYNYPSIIFKNTELDRVNGFDKKKDADRIISLINEERAGMDSKDIMYILIDDKFNGRIVVQNKEYKLIPEKEDTIHYFKYNGNCGNPEGKGSSTNDQKQINCKYCIKLFNKNN